MGLVFFYNLRDKVMKKEVILCQLVDAVIREKK